jgi:hypothetical protein
MSSPDYSTPEAEWLRQQEEAAREATEHADRDLVHAPWAEDEREEAEGDLDLIEAHWKMVLDQSPVGSPAHRAALAWYERQHRPAGRAGIPTHPREAARIVADVLRDDQVVAALERDHDIAVLRRVTPWREETYRKVMQDIERRREERERMTADPEPVLFAPDKEPAR